MLPEELPYTPPEAARQITFSDSLLRRYALIYESIGGHIPTDNRGGRLYPPALLETFSEVRERVKAGEKVKEAMLTVTAGEQLDLPTESGLEVSANDALALLKQILDENRQLNERMAALEGKLDKTLPAPHANGKAKYVCLLERRNTYLEGELKRRDEQPQAKRPWWRVWGK